MGRLIDCNDVYNAIQITTDKFGVAKKVVEDNMLTMLSKIETVEVEAIPKADYKARLKADLVAMLAELQLELEELPEARFYKKNEYGDVIGCIEYPAISKDALLLIQQKINALKGRK